MKHILIYLFASVILLQSGCANRPSIDQQTLQEGQHDQAIKNSDAFAKGLPQ